MNMTKEELDKLEKKIEARVLGRVESIIQEKISPFEDVPMIAADMKNDVVKLKKQKDEFIAQAEEVFKSIIEMLESRHKELAAICDSFKSK